MRGGGSVGGSRSIVVSSPNPRRRSLPSSAFSAASAFAELSSARRSVVGRLPACTTPWQIHNEAPSIASSTNFGGSESQFSSRVHVSIVRSGYHEHGARQERGRTALACAAARR